MSLEKYMEIKPRLVKMFNENAVQFNMAVSTLIQNGWDNIAEVDLTDVRKDWEKQNQEIRDKGTNHIPLISADFMVEMVQLAKEIAAITTPWDILTFAKDYMPIDTGNMSVDKIKAIAYNAICLACDENMYAYDGDEWEEHVMEELDLDEEEYDAIMNEWG